VIFKNSRFRALLRPAVLCRLQRWGYELGLDPDPSSSASTGSVVVYWGVANVDATLKRLLWIGATERTNVQDVGDGIRVATVLDPFGNILGVIENPHFKLPSA